MKNQTTSPVSVEEGNKPFKAKFHGDIYDVRPTKVLTKRIKHHWDFNGYEVEPHTVKSQQWGMFLNEEFCFTVKERYRNNFQVYSETGRRIGSISPMHDELKP